ncbi:MAG TPA: hypothetical protein VH107_09090 [Lacipirellulaceae bacterium]|nr:hypothetical protein [Lacipirellulaceae bacterium]
MEKTSLVTINRSTSNSIGRRGDFALLFLLAAVVLGGCGKNLSVPSTVPVSGVVKFKGKPLQGVRVTLHSQSGTAKPEFIPTGQTGPDGKFKLSTGAPGNGAPPGTYLATFEKPEIGSPASTGSIETEVDAFGGKYSDPTQSKWTVTIEKGENSLQPFELN